MKKEPLISIIIPAYNRAHLISETLDSIIAQTYTNLECIVVDDGSTDNTLEVVEKYTRKDARFQLHLRPKNRIKGANACRNYGFELSTGEYINWFDSDDLMHEDHLKMHMKNLIVNYDCSVSNLELFIDKKSNTYHRIYNITSSDKLFTDYISGKINLGTPCVLWKKSVVSDFSFDTTLKRAQELDFHYKVLRSRNINAGFVDFFTVYVRRHGDSITSSYIDSDVSFLLSELKVRKMILLYVLKSKVYDRSIVCSVLNLYLVAFRKYFNKTNLLNVYKEFFKMNISSFFNNKLTYILWFLKITFYLLVFKTTGRDFKLKKELLGICN